MSDPTPPPASSPAPSPTPAPALLPAPSLAAWGPAAVLYAAVVAYLLVRNIGVPVFDDAYFFKRFALHAIDHGVYAWNLADGPVYGSTSQAFQLLATLAAAISATHYVLVVKVMNAAALTGLAAVTLRWCSRAAGPRGSMVAQWGLGSPLVLTTLLTGMETAITLLVLALVLTAMIRPDGQQPMPPARAAGWTLVLYLFRPDAAIVPAVAYTLPTLLRGAWPGRYAAWLAGLLVATVAVLWAYYGTPLPLSFFMKTSGLQPYGAHVAMLGLGQKQLHFGATLVFAAPLLWLAAHRRDPANLALLGATAALWAYHLLLTNEIMGYRGRFYVPGLVPLCLAAARGEPVQREHGRPWVAWAGLGGLAVVVAVAYANDWIPTPADDALGQIPWPCYAALVVGGAWLLRPGPRLPPALEPAVMGLVIAGSVLGWHPPSPFRVRSDAQLLRIHARQVTTVRGLSDVARCLPDARTVYHSEMGVTGLVLWNTRVVDLVGILSDHVVGGETFEQICERDAPEAIFLPHHNYRELNREIQQSECIADYRRVVDRSSTPLYVRRDLADDFLSCATEVHRYRR